MSKLSVFVKSVDEFYNESNKLESTGNKRMFNEICNKNSPNFVGLSLDEIVKNKYSYRKDLDKIKSIDDFVSMGGAKNIYKYDEFDGDDMNYDRFVDELPYMKKRIKNVGRGNGKFIKLHVAIAENWIVDYKDMLNRAYTVIQIVDFLEDLGYRLEIIAYSDVNNVGSYKEEYIESLKTEILIKSANEPLIKPLVLTCISPWMFRHHMFKFWSAKFNTNDNLGATEFNKYKDTDSDLYIKSGECLNEQTSKDRIKKIINQFSQD